MRPVHCVIFLRRTVLFSLTLISLMLAVSLLSVDPIPAPENHGPVRGRQLYNTRGAGGDVYEEEEGEERAGGDVYGEEGEERAGGDVYGEEGEERAGGDVYGEERDGEYKDARYMDSGYLGHRDKYVDRGRVSNISRNSTNDLEGKWSIPHIVHQAWDDAQVPSQVSSWLFSWLSVHPLWQHWFWTEANSRRLIGRKYPHYLHLYDQYPYKINRADVRRYFIMYEYGGVYADLDVESVRRLDGVLERYPCIIAQEPLVHQVLLYANNASNFAMPAFMACRRQHPFFKLLLDSLHESISLAWSLPWNDNILQSTGPHYVARVLERYEYNDSSDSVYLAPWQWFMPDYDSTNLSAFRNICNNTRNNINSSNTNNNINMDIHQVSAACRLLNKGHKDSNHKTSGQALTPPARPYTRHHWLHTWSSQFSTNATTHVQQINRNIHIASVT